MATSLLKNAHNTILGSSATILLLAGCAHTPSTTNAVPPAAVQTADASEGLLQKVVDNHAEGVYRSWVGVHEAAIDLQKAIDAFVASPSQDTMQAARLAWVEGRTRYAPTEVFRFQNGPIDRAEGPEGLINAWPLDELYIDYGKDSPNSGIIQDVDTWGDLTTELLVELNEKDGEENIATGWHAIEFLLWGQDTNPDGPGARSYTDYVAGGGAPNPERRAAYLQLAAKLLVSHIEPLVQEWAPGQADNHRTKFTANPTASLTGILTGMGMLAGDELAGERIAVAWETRDPEDEQSCFSDTTHLDIIGNAQGIQDAWMGTLAGTTGPGPVEVLRAKDPTSADEMNTSLKEMMLAVKAIPVPFDSAIQAPDDDPRRTAIEDSIKALENQAQVTNRAAKALGLKVNLEGG